MAEYHIGCGIFAIYAGTLNSKNKTLWQDKSDVTKEAVVAVAQYLLQENKNSVFECQGRRYRLCVMPMVRGHWEDVGALSCCCSECGCKNDRETRFCPNCGAKMDLEDKEHAKNNVL